MDKTPEQVIGELVGRIIGNVGYYFLLRRMGAPRYIAYIATGINHRLYEISRPISDEEIRNATIALIKKYKG